MLTLWSAGMAPAAPHWTEVLFFGQLIILMVLISPVCHLAYFVLEMPLIMAVVDKEWKLRPNKTGPRGQVCLLAALFVGVFMADLLTHIPGLDILRDLGLSMYAALVWWAVAWLLIYRDKEWHVPMRRAGIYVGVRRRLATASIKS